MTAPEPPAGSEHYREGWRHGYEQAAIDRERSADTVRPRHLVTSHWDAAGGEVLYRSCTCGEEWARDEDRCPEDDIETLDVADLLDRLDLIQARNPDEQRHLDDTLDALRRELAEPSGDTVQAPDVAGPLVAVRVGSPGSGYLVGPFTPAEAVSWRIANVTVPGTQWAIVPLLPDAARPTAEALLGTDTEEADRG